MQNNVSIKIFRQEAKFIFGISKITQLPDFRAPEFAFIGKSNVGKSSLINLICNRRNLARTSNTPGRTQQINFFSILDKIILVDLPGYGFAKVPLHLKKEWKELILHYLLNRSSLKLVNILIDARHGIKENDKVMAELLHTNNINFQIVFTKSDKATLRDNLSNECQEYFEKLGHSCNIIFTSSRSKEGAKELQSSITKFFEK